MARHHRRHPDAVSAAYLIALNTPAEPASAELNPPTRPIQLPNRGVAAGLVVGLAATSLLGGADGSQAAETASSPGAIPDVFLSYPTTDAEITLQLAGLASVHAEQAAEKHAAQATQAAADQAETDRRAAEAEAARAAQEAAEQAAQAQAAQEAAQAALEATSTGPGAIVPGGRVTSGFGSRWGTLHAGVDVAAPLNSEIHSPVSGTVIRAGAASGFGLAVYIQDANGDVWVFGHMFRMNVATGDAVSTGDLVAWVGNNGQSTGPHVHIERHIGGLNGQKVDPAPTLGL